jgi:hypothetical protein
MVRHLEARDHYEFRTIARSLAQGVNDDIRWNGHRSDDRGTHEFAEP